MCTRGNYNRDNGWCNGDALCPQLGPLDFVDKNGGIVWNHGSPQNYDGFYNTTTDNDDSEGNCYEYTHVLGCVDSHDLLIHEGATLEEC